jgi:hypothetical protein
MPRQFGDGQHRQEAQHPPVTHGLLARKLYRAFARTVPKEEQLTNASAALPSMDMPARAGCYRRELTPCRRQRVARCRALRYRAFVSFESYGPKERSRDPASVDQGQIEAAQILRSLRRIWALAEAMDTPGPHNPLVLMQDWRLRAVGTLRTRRPSPCARALKARTRKYPGPRACASRCASLSTAPPRSASDSGTGSALACGGASRPNR